MPILMISAALDSPYSMAADWLGFRSCGNLGETQEQRVSYEAPFAFEAESACRTIFSIPSCKHFWISALKPVNSIPIPTPPSQARTIEGVVIFSDSIQKLMLNSVPLGSGIKVST